MARSALHLTGILPPITTPFDASGELDTIALARNVARYDEAGLAGFVTFGSSGEVVHLDAGERRQVLETVRRTARPGRVLIAGVNEQSARGAIAAISDAAAAGANAALVITPYFYKGAMSQAILRAFYLEVADVAELPLLIYNNPPNTGVSIRPETVASLAEHPRIIGIKDAAGDLASLAETARATPTGFAVMVGSAAILYPALLMGAAGAILGVACVAPEVCLALDASVRAGDHAGARELQQRLAPLAALLARDLGVAGIKAALDLASYAGGPPRSPLRPLDDQAQERLRATMAASGFFPALV